MNALLQQGFSTGDFDQLASIALHLPDDFFDAHRCSLMECILSIAVRASKVAGCQSHEHARAAHICGFALNTVKNLVDNKLCHGTGNVGTQKNVLRRGRKSNKPEGKRREYRYA
jgi:hypothetical protein